MSFRILILSKFSKNAKKITLNTFLINSSSFFAIFSSIYFLYNYFDSSFTYDARISSDSDVNTLNSEPDSDAGVWDSTVQIMILLSIWYALCTRTSHCSRPGAQAIH